MLKRFGLFLTLWLISGLVGFSAADLNIVFIPKSSDQVFWTFIHSGVDRAVREDAHVNLTWRGPAYNDDSDSQIQILQNYSRPGVDAIVLCPTDRHRLMEPVRKAAEMGIKVISVDSDLEGKYHLAQVATDNFAAGDLVAQAMGKLLKGSGKVLVLRTVKGSASTDQRGDGFVKGIKRFQPGMVLVTDEYGGGSAGKNYHSALKILKEHPDVDGIFAVNESSSEGMLYALRETGRAGKVQFIGFDSSKELLDGLKKKEIQGLMLQDPTQMGYMGMKLAIAAARNQPITTRRVYTGVTLVTLKNLETSETRKLLDPGDAVHP